MAGFDVVGDILAGGKVRQGAGGGAGDIEQDAKGDGFVELVKII